jgi:hypothetical protein
MFEWGLADNGTPHHVVLCHDTRGLKMRRNRGQGGNFVPPYTRGSGSQSLTLSLALARSLSLALSLALSRSHALSRGFSLFLALSRSLSLSLALLRSLSSMRRMTWGALSLVRQTLGSGDGVDGGVLEGAARQWQVHGGVQSLRIVPFSRGAGRRPGASGCFPSFPLEVSRGAGRRLGASTYFPPFPFDGDQGQSLVPRHTRGSVSLVSPRSL